jgi:hypothetical protein
MGRTSDRKELERRLEQSRRLASEPSDPLTKERLNQLVDDIEEDLRKSDDWVVGPQFEPNYLHHPVSGFKPQQG